MATMRSLLAVSTPRSRAEVMSARIDVPATKQPAQPRPIRKKNGVISGEAPVSAVPNAPTPQAARPSRLVRRRPMRSASKPTGYASANMPTKWAAISSCTCQSAQPWSPSSTEVIAMTPTIAAWASAVAVIAARAGPRRNSSARSRGGGGSGIGGRLRYQCPRSAATERGSGYMRAISHTATTPSTGTTRNGPAERTTPSATAPPPAAIATSGPTTAPIAPAVVTVPTPRPRSIGG